MKKIIYLFVAVLTIAFCSCNCQTQAKKTDGIIRTEIPQREAGQTDLIGFRCDPLETVRVGFVGLGMRGPGAVERFTHIPGVEIKALSGTG